MEQQHISSAKSELINKLKDRKYREAYIRSTINVNLPSQIRALRLSLPMTQKEFAIEADMKQPRISAMEKPGATKFNIETLVRLAAAFHVGLIVRFAPMSEMLAWENSFSQDAFTVVPFEQDAGLQRRKASVVYNWTTSAPSWFFRPPRTLRALPGAENEIAMTQPVSDPGSTATVKSFYL